MASATTARSCGRIGMEENREPFYDDRIMWSVTVTTRDTVMARWRTPHVQFAALLVGFMMAVARVGRRQNCGDCKIVRLALR